jgi:hypothetical protein
MDLDAFMAIARPCIRNELNRCEQTILSVEGSKPTPAHLMPKHYLDLLNIEAGRLREALDYVEGWSGNQVSEKHGEDR